MTPTDYRVHFGPGRSLKAYFDDQEKAHAYCASRSTLDSPAALVPLFEAQPDPAAPAEVLRELEMAHQIIRLMLGEMSTDAKARFAAMSEAAGLGPEGATRHHERAAVIARAGGRLA